MLCVGQILVHPGAGASREYNAYGAPAACLVATLALSGKALGTSVVSVRRRLPSAASIKTTLTILVPSPSNRLNSRVSFASRLGEVDVGTRNTPLDVHACSYHRSTSGTAPPAKPARSHVEAAHWLLFLALSPSLHPSTAGSRRRHGRHCPPRARPCRRDRRSC